MCKNLIFFPTYFAGGDYNIELKNKDIDVDEVKMDKATDEENVKINKAMDEEEVKIGLEEEEVASHHIPKLVIVIVNAVVFVIMIIWNNYIMYTNTPIKQQLGELLKNI